MPEAAAVRLPPLAGRQQESWGAFVELAPTLGEHCLLVGGQMVLLLEVERGTLDTRPTDDVDIVIDLRVESAGLARVHQTLIDVGFGQVLPSADGIAHRYTCTGATIDVLAPDRLGSGRTIEAPGGSQALVRSSVVNVELTDGSTARVRRPTVVGALLAQGRRRHADRVADLGRTSKARPRCRLPRTPARPDGSPTGRPHAQGTGRARTLPPFS